MGGNRTASQASAVATYTTNLSGPSW